MYIYVYYTRPLLAARVELDPGPSAKLSQSSQMTREQGRCDPEAYESPPNALVVTGVCRFQQSILREESELRPISHSTIPF